MVNGVRIAMWCKKNGKKGNEKKGNEKKIARPMAGGDARRFHLCEIRQVRTADAHVRQVARGLPKTAGVKGNDFSQGTV
jgi:hypothetical protein